MSKPHQVVVLRTDHVGDGVIFSSAWKPLRERYPDSEIVLLGSNILGKIFSTCPYIDRFVNYLPLRYGFWKKIPMPNKIRRRLAPLTVQYDLRKYDLHPDVLFCPHYHVHHRHLEMLQMIPAREKIGYGEPATLSPEECKLLSKTLTLGLKHCGHNASERMVDFHYRLLSMMNCPLEHPEDMQPELWITSEEFARADELLAPLEGASFGMLIPGSTAAEHLRYWGAERYAEALNLLGDAGPRWWIIDGGPGDISRCGEVAERIAKKAHGHRVLNLASSPIRVMFALLKKARLVISACNGGLHAATAVGTPTVGVVGGWFKDQFFPWGNPRTQRSAMVDVDCAGCQFTCTESSVVCMERILPERVAGLCREVLQAEE